MSTDQPSFDKRFEVEERIVSDVLTYRDAIGVAAGLLTPDEFSVRLHRRVYAAAWRQYRSGKRPDARSIMEALSDDDRAAASELWDEDAPALDGGSEWLFEKCEELLVLARGSGPPPVSDVLRWDDLAQQREEEKRHEDAHPLRLGYGSLDRVLGGVSLGRVLGIAARSGVGKTFMLSSILHNYSVRKNAGSLFLSLEMPGTDLYERQAAIMLDCAAKDIDDHDQSKFLDRMRNSLVCDRPCSLEEIGEVCAAARDRLDVPLRLLLIDYAGLIEAKGRSDYERLSLVARNLKTIAKRERVVLVCAMQLSRAGEPWLPVRMSHIRDSGQLEEACDFILGLWRPGSDPSLSLAEKEQLRDVVACVVAKNRNGRDGDEYRLRFLGSSRRIVEPAEAGAW